MDLREVARVDRDLRSGVEILELNTKSVVLRYFLITTRTLSSLLGYIRQAEWWCQWTSSTGRQSCGTFSRRGICLCFADAKRRSDLERGRGDLAQLGIVVGTGENFGSFLQGTEAITATYGGAG